MAQTPALGGTQAPFISDRLEFEIYIVEIHLSHQWSNIPSFRRGKVYFALKQGQME
jgi:hypothetical protein